MKTGIRLLYLILVISSIYYTAYSFKTQVSIPKPHKVHDLKHSTITLSPPKAQRHHLNVNHELSHISQQFLEVPLETNHIAFQVKFKVEGINYQANVDTGSSDFWIKGENSKGDPYYQYQCGCDYKRDRDQYTLSYLDGDVKLYSQDVSLQIAQKKIEGQILIAYKSGPQFQDVQGIIGLSYKHKAHHNPTFLQILQNEHLIDRYAYGFNFNLIQDDRSYINFGDPDEHFYQGNLSYYDIISTSFIKIRMESFFVGDSSQMKVRYGLIDTGNTCISIPLRYEDQILKQFNTKSNQCKFYDEENVDEFRLLQCRVQNFDELPVFKFKIGQQIFQISHEYYIQYCYWHNGKDYCPTYIESVDVWWESQTVFLGDGFLNRFYTYVDLEQKKVGLAQNQQNITMDDIFDMYTGRFIASDWEGL